MIFKIATAAIVGFDFEKDAGNTIASWKTENTGVNVVDDSPWEFEKREGMMYVAVRAVSVGTNGNGDHFTEDELRRAYKTFVGKGVFVNHASNDVEKKRGKIIDAKWVEAGPAEKYVICLLEMNEKAFPEFCRMIRSHQIDSVSMGCQVAYSQCSVCSHVAKTTKDYCVTGDSLITMADGTQKAICDVAIGDFVISAYGTVNRVVDVKKRHIEEDIIHFKVAGKKDVLKVTKDHPLVAYKNDWACCSQCRTPKGCSHVSSGQLPEFVPAKYLSLNDYLLAPGKVESLSQVAPELAEFIGYYAAEGNLVRDARGPKAVQFSLHFNENALAERILELGKSLFDTTGRVYKYPEKSCQSVRFHNRALSETVANLCRGKAVNKTVDAQIILAQPEAQIAFLSAIVAGDGYYDSIHNAAVFRSASKALSNQVQQVAESLGYTCTYFDKLQVGGPSNRENLVYTKAITITKSEELPTDALAFSKLANVTVSDSAPKSLFRLHETIAFRIREKQYVPFHGEVYNLEVEDAESYLLYGLGSHNCPHVKMHKGGAYNGMPVYEINKGIEFIEVSWVTVGADPQAKMIEVIARQRGLDFQGLLQQAAAGIPVLEQLESRGIETAVMAAIRRANQQKKKDK